MRRQQPLFGGADYSTATSRQSNTFSQQEVESAFQELYNSLLGNQEKVDKTAPKENHYAHTTIHHNLYNHLVLENCPQNVSQDVLKMDYSIPSEHVTLRNSNSGTAIARICSSTAEISRLPTKRPNLKCNAFPRKAKESLKSNTETPVFAVKQPILQTVGSNPRHSDRNEESFELSCGGDDDDAVSVTSGEDYRETVTCEACSEMFWKVVNKRETKKKRHASTKKQPYDPTSLSCDQWVLKKPLLPRSDLQKRRREIRSPVRYLKKLVGSSAQSKVGRKWIPQCSRPHVFLQRNLQSCKRKVDEFLAGHRKNQSQGKTKKRSRKKELFVFKLPETPLSSILLSDNEDSEMEISTVKRKLTSAVVSRGDRTKKGSCDFSDNSNTYESGSYNSDSKSVQCESNTYTNLDKLAFDFRPLNFRTGKTLPAFSTSASLYPDNQLYSQNEKAKNGEETPSKKNSRMVPPVSFDWLKPGGFTSMIAKLKARPLTSGSVVKET
ncbi:uncharacterized protein si:ch211-227n13.3 [Heterodontus francisci]|uniref:uncharacterized protein si:ch211-227n13.3 n=1 Tax=Heterodontus francisci TaxID=7792 RepID=UPI00355C83DA